MQVYRLAHPVYVVARKVLAMAGLSKPARRIIGPVVGRILTRVTSKADRPLVIQGLSMIISQPGQYPPLALAVDKYEEGTTRLLKSIVEPGMVVVDGGAHVGYFSLLLARGVGPTGKVYSFEPEPANFEMLQRNIELNGYETINPVRAALSNQVGSTTLYLTALDNGRHSVYHQDDLPLNGNLEVKTTTLDAFLEAEGWPRVDLIKMDVEGAENDVLDGMKNLLAKPDIPRLIMEFNPALLRSAGIDPLHFLDRPLHWGYKVHWIDDQDGPILLETGTRDAFVRKLLASESSVNLYCLKP